MRLGSTKEVGYWAALVLGAATLVLVVANFILLTNDQTLQAEVSQRQQFINQTGQLSRANDLLVRLLATTSVNAKDDKLRDLLSRHGISFNVTPNPPASAPATAAPAESAPAPKTTP